MESELNNQPWRWVRAILLGLWLGCALMAGVRWASEQEYYRSIQRRTDALALKMKGSLGEGLAVDRKMFEQFVKSERDVGYLVAANFRSGEPFGWLDAGRLSNGAPELVTFHQASGSEGTLKRLVQPQAGFPGSYLEVYSVAFVRPSVETDRTPLGLLKIGFVVPGFPVGRFHLGLWFSLTAGFMILWSGVSLVTMSRKRKEAETVDMPPLNDEVSSPVPFKAEPAAPIPVITGTAADLDSLSDLEETLVSHAEKIRDSEGIEWSLLFDGESLEGWSASGSWFISGEEICGMPWAASLVATKLEIPETYQLRLRAKKISGPDGFIVLFSAYGHQLSWVLGGWENTRGELMGYPSTSYGSTLDENQWIQMDVIVHADEIEGCVNGQAVWKIQRSDVTMPSPNVEFQAGVGVAAYNTIAKFRDIWIRAL